MINLCDIYDCTGCGSCYNSCNHNAITMNEDNEGFLIPQINPEICIECGLCQKSCPVLNRNIKDNLSPKVYGGYILDENIRKISSSGGIFSAFAQSFFADNNGKAKYLVSAEFDEHLVLHHRIVSCYEDITKMRGSKYVQSNIGNIYRSIRQLLRDGSDVLFVGTPCQVAGLYSFLNYKYCDNLYTIDLICHGVPSPKLFSNYLIKIGVNCKQLYYDYWFRDYSSTGFYISSILKTQTRKQKISISKHSYITAYLKGWLHRNCCYRCKFNGIPRQADCTIGDFWGIISMKVPFKGDREHGISVILANTDKGISMINNISQIAYLEEHTIEEAIIDNHNLVDSDIRPKERDYIYKEILELSPNEFMKKYDLHLPHVTIWLKMRTTLGKYVRKTINYLKNA